jgi:hypothetical protein
MVISLRQKWALRTDANIWDLWSLWAIAGYNAGDVAMDGKGKISESY